MQEYIRGGDERKHQHEITALEKRAEHGIKAHQHKLSELQSTIKKLYKKIHEKTVENNGLDSRLDHLHTDVGERKAVRRAEPPGQGTKKESSTLPAIYARRRLVDLAKSQAQDIAILREEVERLRLRTWPAFPARRPEF